ncbi:MAG: hypothetical protein JSR90_17425 [Proteobacteria bacterium]|nr:hypothetical protein [Pseudomonadota bacterium]
MTVIALPRTALESLGREVRAASWFAALGEPLTAGERAEAVAYADAFGLGPLGIAQARDWPEAERLLMIPDGQSGWWEREETQRKALLAKAEARYPERALWTALTELTTEAGDLVHGKAAGAAARLGLAAPASVHVAAGAASQAVYQLAVTRLAGEESPLFENKFRLFAAGRWPLGIVGSTLFVF